MILVSVIIPVYNNEKYITRCINSVLSQTYRNIEVILIDDGSSDNSGLFCDEFSKKDNRIKVIHQKNQGVSVARNVGIVISKGKYIIFVDSDDYISPNLIEKCVESATDDTDIIMFDYIEDYGSKQINKELNNLYCCNYESIIDGIMWDKIPSYPWNKFYKRELWSDIKYPENINFEDLAVMPKIFLKAKSICYIKEALYYYNCANSSSITSNVNSKNKYGMFISFYKRFKLAKEMHMNDLIVHNNCRYIKSAVTAYGLNIIDNKLSKNQIEFLRDCLDESEVDKLNNLGIKYKILFYSIKFNFRFIYYSYGYFMCMYQNIKKYISNLLK